MLDGNDKETFHSLRLLRDVAIARKKPLVFWVGAGVSRWCGYPSWQESAEKLEKNFRKLKSGWDSAIARAYLEDKKFPAVFELCQQTDSQLYRREIKSIFGARAATPVYARFIHLIETISPLQVVTTNVDETLERNIKNTSTVQRSDIELCSDLVTSGEPFLAKIHGSVSSVDSMVLSSTDYEGLLKQTSYCETLRQIFANSTVVFVGYGLRDQYVIELLEASGESRPLFGDGPHFLVNCGDSPTLPKSIHVIRYQTDAFSDHRAALTAIDIIRVSREGGSVWFFPQDDEPLETKRESAYFLSDVVLPGVWMNSQSVESTAAEGNNSTLKPNLVIGPGFEEAELPERSSTALHDLLVGLVSFDRVFAPLACAGNLHDVVGAELFWHLVENDFFRFVHFEYQPAVVFESSAHIAGGDVCEVGITDGHGSMLTAEAAIRRIIKGNPGHEARVEKLYELLASKVVSFDRKRFNVPNLTRGALLHPATRSLLGLSDGILPTSIPRWLMFPVNRLAGTILSGCACEHLGLPATKVGFGSEVLVGAAFSVSAARDWADEVSSYVLTGRFNTDLAAYAQANPSVFQNLLTFRDSASGVELRREISQQLLLNAGAEFVASVNAGLKQIVPPRVLEQAHDQLSALLLRQNVESRIVPAVWTDVRNSDKITALWKKKSLGDLLRHCRTYGIAEGGLCPCGSGDKLRDCCLMALRPFTRR